MQIKLRKTWKTGYSDVAAFLIDLDGWSGCSGEQLECTLRDGDKELRVDLTQHLKALRAQMHSTPSPKE